jgi:hypothetical protein
MSENNKPKGNIATYFVKHFKNRNIFIFIFFIILSSFLWFLNAVNKEHDTHMVIPYQFKNLPAKTKISKESAKELTVLIHGHGFNILREKLEQVTLPVIIDFANKDNPVVFHRCENNPLKTYVLTKELIPFLSRRFGSNIKVTGVKPDTLFFDIADNYSKKIPIITNPSFNLDPGYIISGKILSKPDSVYVYGPKHITDTISAVYSETYSLGNVGQTTIKELKLKPIRDLSFSHSKVTLEFPVEKYTQTSIELPVTAAFFPDSLKYQIIPAKVTVTYKVALSQYDKVDKSNFEAIVNYNNKKNEMIVVEVNSINPYVEISGINPISVECILERKR